MHTICCFRRSTLEKKSADALLEALSVFDACCRIVLFSKPFFWVMENPVGRLKDYIGKPNWIFHPYHYGDPYSKKTCLWGDFVMPYQRQVKPISSKDGHHSIDTYNKMRNKTKPTTGLDKCELRSITPSGFAQLFFEANK